MEELYENISTFYKQPMSNENINRYLKSPRYAWYVVITLMAREALRSNVPLFNGSYINMKVT